MPGDPYNNALAAFAHGETCRRAFVRYVTNNPVAVAAGLVRDRKDEVVSVTLKRPLPDQATRTRDPISETLVGMAAYLFGGQGNAGQREAEEEASVFVRDVVDECCGGQLRRSLERSPEGRLLVDVACQIANHAPDEVLAATFEAAGYRIDAPSAGRSVSE